MTGGLAGFLRAGTVGTWGVGLLTAGIMSGAAGRRWIIRALPFLALVYLQPFFATNVDRLLVFGFLAVIPLSVLAWSRIRERFQLRPWMTIGYAATGYSLLLFQGRSNFNSPSPEKELLVLAAWTAVVAVVRIRSRKTHLVAPGDPRDFRI